MAQLLVQSGIVEASHCLRVQTLSKNAKSVRVVATWCVPQLVKELGGGVDSLHAFSRACTLIWWFS